MKVNKVYLLLISSIVWLMAGFNVSKIGLISYIGNISIINILLSCLVFCVFWFMIFNKMAKKHETRIMGYAEKENIFKFFDVKSYIIVIFMITLGIVLRKFVPVRFIAIFYTGLGLALFMAGIKLFIRFIM